MIAGSKAAWKTYWRQRKLTLPQVLHAKED